MNCGRVIWHTFVRLFAKYFFDGVLQHRNQLLLQKIFSTNELVALLRGKGRKKETKVYFDDTPFEPLPALSARQLGPDSPSSACRRGTILFCVPGIRTSAAF